MYFGCLGKALFGAMMIGKADVVLQERGFGKIEILALCGKHRSHSWHLFLTESFLHTCQALFPEEERKFPVFILVISRPFPFPTALR